VGFLSPHGAGKFQRRNAVGFQLLAAAAASLNVNTMNALDALPSAQSSISAVDAYRAMLQVLEYYFRVDPEYAVGAMLGDLSPGVWADGTPGDPASWSRWLKAIQGNLVADR
jgi:hypothetical protein